MSSFINGRAVRVVCSQFQVVENDNYEKCLCRESTEKGQDWQAMGLYRVESVFPMGADPIHVIAESEDGAISQAIGFDQDKTFYTAKKVPFMIRGWGRDKF